MKRKSGAKGATRGDKSHKKIAAWGFIERASQRRAEELLLAAALYETPNSIGGVGLTQDREGLSATGTKPKSAAKASEIIAALPGATSDHQNTKASRPQSATVYFAHHHSALLP